jgi:Flp pilus assembly protein TadG
VRGLTSRAGTGQSLVEFALVFPIFLLLLFGLIDIGRFVYTANALNQAAREGARYGSVASWSETCSGSRDACVREETANRLAGVAVSQSDVTVKCWRYNLAKPTEPSAVAIAQCRTNDFLSVELETDFKVLTPVIGQFIGATKVTGYARVAVNQ